MGDRKGASSSGQDDILENPYLMFSSLKEFQIFSDNLGVCQVEDDDCSNVVDFVNAKNEIVKNILFRIR